MVLFGGVGGGDVLGAINFVFLLLGLGGIGYAWGGSACPVFKFNGLHQKLRISRGSNSLLAVSARDPKRTSVESQELTP